MTSLSSEREAAAIVPGHNRGFLSGALYFSMPPARKIPTCQRKQSRAKRKKSHESIRNSFPTHIQGGQDGSEYNIRQSVEFLPGPVAFLSAGYQIFYVEETVFFRNNVKLVERLRFGRNVLTGMNKFWWQALYVIAHIVCLSISEFDSCIRLKAVQFLYIQMGIGANFQMQTLIHLFIICIDLIY